MKREMKGFTNEELKALADKGIYPDTAHHLKSFLRSVVENLGGQFRKTYYEGETHYERFEGP